MTQGWGGTGIRPPPDSPVQPEAATAALSPAPDTAETRTLYSAAASRPGSVTWLLDPGTETWGPSRLSRLPEPLGSPSLSALSWPYPGQQTGRARPPPHPHPRRQGPRVHEGQRAWLR